MAKKRILVDFDNTMGVPGCDVDDGLALLYLLGCEDAAVEAVCSTYGNNTLNTVHETTERTLALYGLEVPLLRGLDAPLAQVAGTRSGTDAGERCHSGGQGEADDEGDAAKSSAADRGSGDYASSNTGAGAREGAVVADARTTRAVPALAQMEEAAATAEAPRFLADALAAAPGELHILATGSTTNLGAACLLRPDALADAASITLMGGITRSLAIQGRIMNELNLSCDPIATAAVLACGAPTAIATAQNCLPAFFTRDDLISAFGSDSWLYRTCDYWFRTMDAAYDWSGWVCWDVVAAARLMHPELFESRPAAVTLDERLLSVGYLELDNPDAPHAMVDLPQIRDAAAFKAHVLESWRRGLARADL